MVVYAIKSLKDGRIYVGMTDNLSRRLYQHNSGQNKSTKGFRPWILIFTENQPNRTLARTREKYLKSGIGKEFLKTLSDMPDDGAVID